MIRPFTCLCMLLAAAAGLYLYQSKHRVQLLDHEIAATVQASQQARARTELMRAEWALRNEPERLAQFAERFLTLKTVQPSQFTSMAELDNRLPPVRAPEAAPMDVQPDAAPPAPVAQAEPPPRPAEPVHVAEPPRPAASPPRVAARAPERRPVPAPQASGSLLAMARAPAAAAPAPVPRPVPISAFVPAPAAPSRQAAVVTGSVLGMTRTAMAPPVPYTGPENSIPNGN